jgi:hypothetical protein
MFGLITAFVGVCIVIFAVFSQIPEYKGIPTPVTWEIKRSVMVALIGMLIFGVGILLEEAGI